MRKNHSLRAACCSIIGHNYEVTHVVNERVHELCCSKCGKQITNNIYGKIVPLNERYSKINKALNDMARKRLKARALHSYSQNI
jgi:PHP family Zn ribbon phosphoesterase